MWQRRLDSVLEAIVATFVFCQVIIMFATVLCRWLFNYEIMWSQEVGAISLAMIAFLGGALAYSRGEHIAVEVVTRRLPQVGRDIQAASVDWLILSTSVLASYLSISMVEDSVSSHSPMMGISGAFFTFPLPLGLAIMAVIALLRLWARPRMATGIAGVGTLIIVAAMVVATLAMGPWGLSPLVLWGTFILFVLLLAIGVPVAFVLAMVAFGFLFVSGENPILSVPGAMFSGIQSYVLLAIPLFIYAGYIMTEGGLSRRLAEAVMALIGRMQGGLLQVMIVTIYIVSGISGSKVADVAAVGSTMDGMLRRSKYDMEESAAVLAAAAVMGETVPPSTPMIVLGSITTLSVGSLFMAGLLPAAVLAILLMTMVYFRARKLGLQRGPAVPCGEVVRAVVSGVPPMLVPVLLIGGIIAGIATPTEVSSLAVILALVLGAVFYRELDTRSFYRSLIVASTKAGMVIFIIAAASAFSWSLAVVQLPDRIGHLLTSFGSSHWLFLSLTVVTLMITGAVLEGMPALIIFGPLLLPVATELGINPLHYGIVLIMAMGIGTFTPPVGIGLYATCSVMKTNLERTSYHLVPYLILLFLGILAVAFVPWVTLSVPNAFHILN